MKDKSGNQWISKPMNQLEIQSPVNHEADNETSLKEKFAKGNGIPISIRYKKLGNEEIQKNYATDYIFLLTSACIEKLSLKL